MKKLLTLKNVTQICLILIILHSISVLMGSIRIIVTLNEAGVSQYFLPSLISFIVQIVIIILALIFKKNSLLTFLLVLLALFQLYLVVFISFSSSSIIMILKNILVLIFFIIAIYGRKKIKAMKA